MPTKLTVYKFETNSYTLNIPQTIGTISLTGITDDIVFEVYFWADFGDFIGEIAYFKKILVCYKVVSGIITEITKEVLYVVENFTGGAEITFDSVISVTDINFDFETTDNIKFFCRVVRINK